MIEQKNIPELRFPEYSGEWGIKKLNEIASKIGDGIHGTPKYDDEGEYYFINGNNLVEGRILITDNTKRVDENEFQVHKRDLSERTLLLSINGTIGNLAYYNGEAVMLGKSAAYINIDEGYDLQFSFHTLMTNRIQSYFNSELTGTTIKNLSLKTIRGTKISLPSLPEQQKIASFFTAIDKKISQLKQKKTLLEQYKKGVMQKIFSQEIRFRDDNGQEFPMWEKKRLGEVLYEHLDKNDNDVFSEVFSVAKEKGVINQIEHLGRSFAAKSITHYKLIHNHDIVYTKSPTSDFPFGIIKQNMTGRTGVVSPLYGVFKPETKALGFILHNYFLSWINTYNYLKPLVQKGAKNTMNINNHDFLNGAKLSLPVSVDEQKKIANFISTIDNKINHTQTEIEKAELWKKGLMQKMFV